MLFWKKKGKKTTKKAKSNIITAETLCATCATFSFLAFVALCSKSWIFGSVGETVHICLTGLFGYFAYPIFLGIIYLCVTALLGKKFVKNRKFGGYFAFLLIFLGLVAQTAMTYSWPMENYVKQCFLSGQTFPDTTVCGAVGGFVIEKAVELLSKRGVIVFFSTMAAFFACLCCLAVKKPAKSIKKEEKPSKQSPAPVQKNTPTVQAANTAQQESVPAGVEDSYVMPTMQQRPAVVLGGDTAQPARPSMETVQEGTADPSCDARGFLFGSSPAENYQRNLIFDPNSRVNRRSLDGANVETESVYIPSYADAYETDKNRPEMVAPAMVVEDTTINNAMPYHEASQTTPNVSYEREESYLNVSEEPSIYNPTDRYETLEE